jgi:L-2-hydroxycarboxylate dehydrogenase (NAD+)
MNMIIDVIDLRGLCEQVLGGHGLSEKDAHIVVDVLIEAELRGRPTHGVIRLPGIVKKLLNQPPSAMKLERDGGAYALIDGQANLGYLVAHRCARTVIARTDRSGIGVVGAYNTGHCGMLGYYTSMLVDSGICGDGDVRHEPSACAVGGKQAVLGTNPISAAFPMRGGQVLVDLSSAAITNGELLIAIKDGQQIPEGVALSAEGAVTTDPESARKRAALPFGGHKGFALAMMIQIFSGVLMRGDPVPAPGQNCGFFIMGLDPEIFGAKQDFLAGVNSLVEQVKNSARPDGVSEILIPGERAFREKEMRLSEGIPVDDDLLDEIKRA